MTSFEMDEGGIQCWNVIEENAGYPMVYDYGFAHNGQSALTFLSYGNSTPCMISSPLLEHRADSLLVSFWLTMNAGEGTMQIGLMGDTIFYPIIFLDLSETPLGYYEFYTDGFALSDTMSLAFRVVGGRLAIDDVTVRAATSCRRPCSVDVTDVGIYAAEAVWESCGSTAIFYVVRLVDILLNDTIEMLASDTALYIGGLNPGTSYLIEVASLCDGDTLGWTSSYFTTEVTCRRPVNVSLDALTATSAGFHWEYDSLGINMPTGITVILEDLYTHTVTDNIQTTSDYLFFDSLTTGHRYRATFRTVCSTDTSSAVSLTFVPLAEACIDHHGSGLNSNYPINCSRNYSYSQTLYPGSLVAGMDTLYAIALRMMSNPSALHRTVDIYIGSTENNSLTENISTMWSMHVVENYSIDNPAEGWLTIPFNYPVAVDSSRNLLVTIVDHSGSANGYILFGNHTEAYGGTLYGWSNDVPFDPSISSMQLLATSMVADIQLFGNCASGSCQAPAAMVTASSSNSITVSWVGTMGSYVIRYRPDGGQWTETTPIIGTVYTLNQLNASSHYTINVGLICGADTVFGDEIEAFTACGIVNLPYGTVFSGTVITCWQGQQTPVSGGVRINDVLISPEIGQDANTTQVRVVIGGYGGVRIGVCDADGENMQWVETVYNSSNSDFTEHIVYLDSYVGTSRRIAIESTHLMTVLSEVVIEQIDDCLPPRTLTVYNITGNRATLNWNGTAAHYQIRLHELVSDRWSEWQTQNTSITLTGLASNTFYEGYIVSSCSSGNSVPTPFEFTTECYTITSFPYFEGFESAMAPAQCWRTVDADPGHHNPMIHTDWCSFSGQRSFRFSSFNYVESNNYDQYLISPRIESDDSIWLEFSYTKDNIDHETFAVGYSIFESSIEEFIWLENVEPTAGQWLRYRVGLPSATRYVAIHYMGENNYYLYIDDLTIDGPGCSVPTVTMIDEQSDAVSVGWIANGDTSYVAITDGIWLSSVDGVAVTGNEYTFSGLEPGRYYTLGIRSRCPDGHLSDWTTCQVATINTACTPPTSIAVTDVDYTSAYLSWIPEGEEHLWQICLLSDDVLISLFQPVITTEVAIVDLEQGREYSLLLRAICGEIPGPWSDTVHFTTLDCPTVSNLSYTRIDFRTVSLSWTEAPVSIGRHRVEYGEHGFALGTGNVIESNSVPLIIDNLEPEPEYDFYVFNYCQPGVASNEAVSITVPSGLGIDGLEMQSGRLNIYPNPAISQVTIGGLEQGAFLQIIDMSGRIVDEFRTDYSTIQIDVSNYSSGTYYLRATATTYTSVGKLTVNR